MRIFVKFRIEKYCFNRYGCFLLQYHLVPVTKYRHKVIKSELKEFLLQYVKDYFKADPNLDLLEVNTEPDHIHILFNSAPQVNLAYMINNLKSASSRMIRKQFEEELKPYYWIPERHAYGEPYFWSLSYYLGTVSDRNAQIIRRYIQNQKG